MQVNALVLNLPFVVEEVHRDNTKLFGGRPRDALFEVTLVGEAWSEVCLTNSRDFLVDLAMRSSSAGQDMRSARAASYLTLPLGNM